MSDNRTVHKHASLRSGLEPPTEEEVEAAKAAASGTRRDQGGAANPEIDPIPDTPGVSSHDRAAAIKNAGSDGEPDTEPGKPFGADDNDYKAAVHLAKQAHNERERERFGGSEPFDARGHERAIRKATKALRRLKVLRGKSTPRTTDERRLARMDTDEKRTAAKSALGQLPRGDSTAAAIKNADTGSPPTALEKKKQERRDGFVTAGQPNNYTVGPNAIHTGDD